MSQLLEDYIVVFSFLIVLVILW